MRLGVGYASTYTGKDSRGQASAAGAIPVASQEDASLLEDWDFDLGGPLFDDQQVCGIDAGDIHTIMHNDVGNRSKIEAKGAIGII